MTQSQSMGNGLKPMTAPGGAPSNQASEAVDDQLGLRLVALQQFASCILGIIVISVGLVEGAFCSLMVVNSCVQTEAVYRRTNRPA